MTLDRCQQQAERFLAGELGPSEARDFIRHARLCEECGAVVELDAELRGSSAPDVLAAVEGDGLRSSVMRELRRQQVPRSHRPAWMPMAAAAMLALGVGLAGGRLWSSAASEADDRPLARLIQEAALDTRTLADVENSPYMFTNVGFRAVDDTRVAIGFDVSTHVELTANRSDPLVRQLAVQAVLNPSPVGARLDAIAYAGGVPDRAVMNALRVAMLNDQNLAVRLKALEALAPYKNDPEVQAALLMVLTTADSVPMRLQAIDYLVAGSVDPQAMREAMRELHPVEDRAALVKASAYVN
jgi:hypothetical protein